MQEQVSRILYSFETPSTFLLHWKIVADGIVNIGTIFTHLEKLPILILNAFAFRCDQKTGVGPIRTQRYKRGETPSMDRSGVNGYALPITVRFVSTFGPKAQMLMVFSGRLNLQELH